MLRAWSCWSENLEEAICGVRTLDCFVRVYLTGQLREVKKHSVLKRDQNAVNVRYTSGPLCRKWGSRAAGCFFRRYWRVRSDVMLGHVTWKWPELTATCWNLGVSSPGFWPSHATTTQATPCNDGTFSVVEFQRLMTSTPSNDMRTAAKS